MLEIKKKLLEVKKKNPTNGLSIDNGYFSNLNAKRKKNKQTE